MIRRAPAAFFAIFFPAVFVLPPSVPAQQAAAEQLAAPALPPGGKLTVIERSDLQKYQDGKYIGLENREVRGILDWMKGPDGSRIEGTFYVIGELNRGGTPVAQKVDISSPAVWTVGLDGVIDVAEDSPYPILRGFPVFPTRALTVGDSWKAPGARMVEPFRDGRFTRVKILSSYRYIGDKVIDGKPFRMITAKYAVTYRKPLGPVTDERVLSISGTHTVSIQLSAGVGELSFMSDVMEETYQLADSKSLTYKGFILTWFNASAPLDTAKTAEEVAAELKKAGVVDVGVEQKSEGVSITINAIHFVADRATVLAEEGPRLEAVAEALKQIPSRTFLVIGHTAAVGTPESQMDLSVQRAKAIVDILVSRGIDPKRLLYEGKGGTQPVAPNDTEENMARNRRVEIIVLED
jgi:OOP family OmpA-OmpF porin